MTVFAAASIFDSVTDKQVLAFAELGVAHARALFSK